MDIKSEVKNISGLVVIKRVKNLAKNGDKTFLFDITNSWKQRVQAQFVARSDPYGNPWKKLAPLTISIKKAQGAPQPDRPLYAFGRLFNSFFAVSTPFKGILASSLPEIAEKHDLGGKPATFFPFSLIPKRQIYPNVNNLPESWQKDINAAFTLLQNRLVK
jgi:hypothetical protein